MKNKGIPNSLQTEFVNGRDGGNGSYDPRFTPGDDRYNQKALRRFKRKEKQIGVQLRRNHEKAELKEEIRKLNS